MSLIQLEEKDESPLVNAFKSVTALSKSESECISRNIFQGRKAKWGSLCVKSLKTRVGKQCLCSDRGRP